jgi:hypothetical protein
VEAAAWTNTTPFISTSNTDLWVEGIDSVGALGSFTYTVTTHDYFRTMGTRILRGRGFSPADREGSTPVTVVSASMARVLWPGAEPLGKCIRPSADTMPCYQVVGVAEDMVPLLPAAAAVRAQPGERDAGAGARRRRRGRRSAACRAAA